MLLNKAFMLKDPFFNKICNPYVLSTTLIDFKPSCLILVLNYIHEIIILVEHNNKILMA